jgi:hypothetical protein
MTDLQTETLPANEATGSGGDIVRQFTWRLAAFGLAGAIVLGFGAAARAQFTGMTGSTSSFGSTGGRTTGGGPSAFGGNSSTGGSFAGTASRTGSGSGSNSYGSTSFLGSYYANPMAFGLPTQANLQSQLGNIGSSGSSSGLGPTGITRSGTSGTSGTSGSTLSTSKNTTAAVPFGQPLYNISTTGSRTGTTGSATVRSLSPTTTGQTQPFSTQTQSQPSYTARVGFRAERVPMEAAVASFRQALQGSPELSLPENRIEVVVDGNGLILRGTVQTDRDRYLAGVLASMTPGVRGVRNELEVRESETALAPR